MTALSPLHIFTVGAWTDLSGRALTFGAADLAATAAAYDPAKHEAPLVVGHPATDDPAYGWVASLRATATDLEATPRQVDTAFAEMVNAERFNRISASFFLPDAPSNPAPGVYYLKHVGFLGAAPPAVKGLRKPSFDLADSEESVTVEFSLHPSSDEAPTVPDTPKTSPGAEAPPAPPADFAAQLSALEASNAELQRALARRDAEIAAEKAKQIQADNAAFAETLVQEGRLLPRDKAGVVEFLAAIPAERVIEFADGGQVVKPTARAWLDDFLKRLPVQVDFGERTAGAAPEAGVQFAAPPGYDVDASQLALHRKALAAARDKNIPYEQALRAVRG